MTEAMWNAKYCKHHHTSIDGSGIETCTECGVIQDSALGYKIVVGRRSEAENKVNNLYNLGYVPVGGVQVYRKAGGFLVYVQAVCLSVSGT